MPIVNPNIEADVDPKEGEGKVISMYRSEMMQEIITHKPGFLIQWGNSFFLLILMLTIIACWFIKYPDIIQASAKLASINSPKPVINLTNGKLIKLFSSENQSVIKDQVIGYIESTANHEEVLRLASSLDSIQSLLDNNATNQIKKYFFSTGKKLGELQSANQTFSQAYFSFDKYLSNGFYLKKREMLLKDRGNLSKLSANLNEQKGLQEQDLDLTQKTFEANESLKKDKVISDFDYRAEKSKLINKKLTLPQIKSAIINNENQQNEKEKEIIELENTIAQQKFIFQQSLSTFKSQVDEWLKKYTLIAPISGKVAFASFVQENQQLQANQTICYINPEDSKYFAEIVIPQSNFGKVSIGQPVQLKFQSYPFEEYGAVIGRIEFISHIPTDSGYLAKVGLTDDLATTYHRKIQYRDGLTANAEIITKDMRLLERFYYSFARQIKK
jgi:multidrug efflux pump subunit AcrA (membrane-fusion protein)